MTQSSMGASVHIHPVICCGWFGRLPLAITQKRLSQKVVKFGERCKPLSIDPPAIKSFGRRRLSRRQSANDLKTAKCDELTNKHGFKGMDYRE